MAGRFTIANHFNMSTKRLAIHIALVSCLIKARLSIGLNGRNVLYHKVLLTCRASTAP